MTVGAINNAKYPYQPSTGASAVSIQIFEPKAYTNTGELPEGVNSAYNMPKENLYGPKQEATSEVQTKQAATMPAQLHLTPEALQETINAAVKLATAKAVEEALAKINAQSQTVSMVQNNGTQNAQAPQGNMEAVQTTPPPQIMPNSAIAETIPAEATAQSETPAESKDVAAAATATATVNVNSEVAQPETETKAEATPEEAPEVTPANNNYEPVQKVDIAKVIAGLESEDLNVQTQTIEAISSMTQAQGDIAFQLVEDTVMGKLAQIASVDVSKLEGPSKERLEIAEKLKKGKKITNEERQILDTSSPKEIAVKNKVISMYTLALLQKLQRDEVDSFNAAQPEGSSKIPNVQIGELIGFKEMMQEASGSEIPVVRKAALEAISYVLRPEEGEIAKELLTPFVNDKDADVQKIAKRTLASYNQ